MKDKPNSTALATTAKNLEDELNGAYLYEALSAAEKDARLAEVYRRMAEAERKHASVWINQLESAGHKIPAFRPNWRTVVLAWAVRRFGPAAVLPTITGLELLRLPSAL